jgi:phage host-nuclease inhibitor protein Gam
MTKRQKLEPCIITSRAALDAVVADVVKLKLQHAQATAAMEQEIAEVQKRHQKILLELSRQIEAKEAGVYVYCSKNRAGFSREKIDGLFAGDHRF